MAYRQNVQSKMSFSIEELSKSSRVMNPVRTDAVVNHIHDIYLPTSSQSCTADMVRPLSNSDQRTQNKKKRQDSLHSDNSFSSTDSSSRDCTSPGSCSDDSDKSYQQPIAKRVRTAYTNSQLMELELYYSNRKYLQIEDQPVLAMKLKLSQHKIKWWFQNRRMKEKRHIKSTSYNSPRELSQFVGVGKPGSRIISTIESNGNISQQSYSPFPMVSPYTYGMSPFVYPGYSQQLYSSVLPQPYRN